MSKRLIYVVEDDKDHQAYLELLIEELEMGITIEFFDSVSEVVNAIRCEIPSLITLDLGLKDGKSGTELLPILHQDLKLDIPVIIISSDDTAKHSRDICPYKCKKGLDWCHTSVVVCPKPFDALFLQILLKKMLLS